ncbi:hypothetical protein [Verrucosispora sp. TAA-831]|uniref:hypothetical protein n=1 Tax=Verrucosispora sp. TAA-831 TaxID=3422227 RepID=UPI003D6DCC34
MEAGHLVPLGPAGLYAFTGGFESIVQAVDAWLLTLTSGDEALHLRLPPVCGTDDYLRAGYLASFPQLAGAVYGFDGDEGDHTVLRRQHWTDRLAPAGLMLVSAACQPVFPMFRGELPRPGRRVDLLGHCFRREPSVDPARMQSFRQREFLFLGNAADATGFRDRWVERGQDAMHELRLPVRAVTANDPFFGRAGKLLATHQRKDGAKIELVTELYHGDSSTPTALASCNAHGDRFGHAFDIRCADGATAHTSCVGFGLERLALALLRVHGPHPTAWPAQVRRSVGV